jgi:hypothetical protein
LRKKLVGKGMTLLTLVTKYMNECLEVWEDEALDEEIRGDAQGNSR